jgi:hypothetical protein
MSGTSTYSES